MADDEYGNEVDLDSIEDEATLMQLLDETEDFDERKMIRARLREVQQANRAKREEQMRKREQEREDAIKKRAQEAADQKKRTLAMYDQMAKSAPAGGPKVMDIGIYKNDGSAPTIIQPKQDLVEDAIRQRHKEAEDRKKRILAAFDDAAKSGPAGTERIVRFDAFKKADVTEYTPPTPAKTCTFGMSGGVPLNRGDSRPCTPASPPILPGGPRFPQPIDPEGHLDPMERAIRARIKHAEEQKRRTLAAYDIIAKTGAPGPKMVILEEFKNLDVPEQLDLGSKHRATSSFRGGVLTAGKNDAVPNKPAAKGCCFRGVPKY